MKTIDNELAIKAGAGDATAFQKLLELHYDTIFRIALRYTGLREDAEDLTQDICTSLPEKLRLFRGQAKFTTWLYRVVVNSAHDKQRKQSTFLLLNRDYSEILTLRQGSEADAEKQQTWLYETLNEVGKDLRDTAILVLAEGLSHQETAEILDIKEATVSWRMHELRKKLKAIADQEL